MTIAAAIAILWLLAGLLVARCCGINQRLETADKFGLPRKGPGMSIVTTRAQRRELGRQNSKMPRELRLVPREEWPLEHQQGPIQRVWRNRYFLVQEYAEPEPILVRLSVTRTTINPQSGRWIDGISWDEMQQIKDACGYVDHDALELYPMASDVVNVANIRHLWVMREPVVFVWRNDRS